MNKRYSMLFSVTAVGVLAATLFGSTYTQSQIVGSTLAASSNDSMTQKIHDMGGLKLVMPKAFAAVDCDNQEWMDRQLAAGKSLLANGRREEGRESFDHYVAVVGRNDKGNYIVNDPWTGKQTDWSAKQLEKFQLEGYAFDAKASEPDRLVFRRRVQD